MNQFLCVCMTVLLFGAASDLRADDKPVKKQAQERKMPAKLQHVVAFKFKESATPEQIQRVADAFVALKGKIPEIAALEWGTNNSPEALNKGFTHCFIVTFKSEKDREVYLPHPDHKAFVEILKPVLDEVFVIDFWAK